MAKNIKHKVHFDINKALKRIDDLDIEFGVFGDAGNYPDGTLIADVAKYVEFGTKFQNAQPFIRFVLRENRNKYQKLYQKLFRKVLLGQISKDSAIRQIADELILDMKRKVPVDSGTLRDAIDAKVKS